VFFCGHSTLVIPAGREDHREDHVAPEDQVGPLLDESLI